MDIMVEKSQSVKTLTSLGASSMKTPLQNVTPLRLPSIGDMTEVLPPPDVAAPVMTRVRDQWISQMEYVIMMIALSIGLAYMWVFPSICHQKEGGSLIPYILSFIFLGFPNLLLEAALGQYFQASILSVWRICPILKGVGFLTFIVVVSTIVYLGTMVSWLAVYMCASATLEDLPWKTCNHSWNSKKCIEVSVENLKNMTYLSSAEEFLKQVTNRNSDVYSSEHQIYLLCLLAALWLACYLYLFRGIKLLGKLVTMTVFIPSMMTCLLFVRCVTLPGASDGLTYFFSINFETLLQPEVWYASAIQAFFSYGIGYGVIITFSSYNHIYTNIWRISIIIAVFDFLFTMILSIIVYSMIGFIAQKAEKKFEDFTVAGEDMVFLTYPQAISLFPAPSVWAFVYFTGSVFGGFIFILGLIQTLITALEDEYNICKKYRWITVLLTCLVLFVFDVIVLTQFAVHFVPFFNIYGAVVWAAMIEVIFEVLSVCYNYGAANFLDTISGMIGYSLPKYFKYLWLYASPAVLGILIFFAIFKHFWSPHYSYPLWAEITGILITIISVACIPGYMIYSILKFDGRCAERIRKARKPSKDVQRIRRQSRRKTRTEEELKK